MNYSKVIFTRYTAQPNYRTPKAIYEELNKEFHFNFDPCPFRSKKKNGLVISWKGRVYVNPPYAKPVDWVQKAMEELYLNHCELVVFLLKGDIGTKLFHHVLVPNATEIRAIEGRLSFKSNGDPAPFPSMVVVF